MSNRLALIPGTSATFDIALSRRDGSPIPARLLADAIATFTLKTLPSDSSSLLFFTTPDPAHLVLDSRASRLTLSFAPADTTGLALGTPSYQIELTLSDGEVVVPIEWTPVDVSLGGDSAPAPPTFDATVALDEDYGGDGTLRYVTAGGSPIEGAQIRVYRKQDWDAGLFDAPVGTATTDANGAWTNPVLVTPGFMYVVQFFQPYAFGPDSVTLFA